MKLKQKLILTSQAIILILTITLLYFTLSVPAAAQPNRALTPAELAAANGQNGAPAYVAVDGLVYDLTSVPSWANGRHYCSGAIAGKDITFLWNLVPPSHKDPNFLKRFKVVGKLAATKTDSIAAPTNDPEPATTPPPPSQEPSLLKLLIGSLGIAIVITAAWLFLRLKR